jgi:hypothetical protein
MSLILNRWRLYCSTESTYVYVWLDENQTTPTTCPNNNAHTISGDAIIVEKRDPTVVSISQETTATGEHYCWSTKSFTALANQMTAYSFSYPIPISVLNAKFISEEENRGDMWTWAIAKNTVIGAITNTVNIGDTVINVSSTVLTYVAVGFYVNLFNGTTTNELGLVLSKNTTNSTITVQTATTHAFSPATPTYVRMSIMFMKDALIGSPWCYEYGEAKIKTSYVPAGTNVTVEYTNNSASEDKLIVVHIEYMY